MAYSSTATAGRGGKTALTGNADVNIELNEISATLALIIERITRPVRYVLATGGNLAETFEGRSVN